MKQSQENLLYLLVVFNVLPHASDLPYWIWIASLTFVFWRFVSKYSRIPIPGKWGILSLTLLSGFGVFNEFGNVIGNESSTAILVLMAGLKSFELRTYRDQMVLTYLCFFLLMSKLIASQTIIMTIYMGLDVILILALMRSYHAFYDARSPGKLFVRSALLIGASAPVILLLFFLFPRFSSGFGTPKDSRGNISGFSGEFRPGSISDLMLSEEPAFRAVFVNGDKPHASQLYWRGLTLTESQGLNWADSKKIPYLSRRNEIPREPNETAHSDSKVEYEIFLEPHGDKYLFALDWPLRVEQPGRNLGTIKANRLKNYRSAKVVDTKLFYRGESQLSALQVSWGADLNATEKYLEVADVESPRSQNWSESLKQKFDNPAEIVKEILNHFAQEGFSYTLSPPPVETIDDFFWGTRRGFCEHYAGTMATLLRWAGVPARVVIGYQGGADSILKDYLLIRQLDAHAWIEYFDPTKNTWVRVDPTSVVAPERVLLGAQRFLEGINESQFKRTGGALAILDRWLGSSFQSQLLRLQLLRDQAEMVWSSFLLKYDFSYQQELFRSFGVDDLTRIHLVAYLLISVAILVIFVFIWSSRSQIRLTPSQRLYRLALQKLEKNGFKKRPEEGPRDFYSRLTAQNGAMGKQLEPIFAELIALRYGKPHQKEISLKQLEKKIKEFRP